MAARCTKCQQLSTFASNKYLHSFSNQKYITCKEPKPLGERVCWHCDLVEPSSVGVLHDLVGNGHYTCEILPNDKTLCMSCGEHKKYTSPYYKHKYAGFVDKEPEFDNYCAGRSDFGYYYCWNCHIDEKDVGSDTYTKHDFTGHGIYSCSLIDGKKRCRNCRAILKDGENHENDGQMGSSWYCPKKWKIGS